jgi:hypothetical protein
MQVRGTGPSTKGTAMRAVVVAVVLTAAVTSVVMYVLQFGVTDWNMMNGSSFGPVSAALLWKIWTCTACHLSSVCRL